MRVASRSRVSAVTTGAPSPAVGVRWILDIEGVRAALAGIAGGAAMGLFEAIATASLGRGLLAPLELIGASHPIARAHPVLVGLAMHLTTAAFWGTRLGIVVTAAPPRLFDGWRALACGILWGAAVWVLMGKIVGPLANPLVASAPEPQFFLGHLVYGVVSVLALRVLVRR